MLSIFLFLNIDYFWILCISYFIIHFRFTISSKKIYRMIIFSIALKFTNSKHFSVIKRITTHLQSTIRDWFSDLAVFHIKSKYLYTYRFTWFPIELFILGYPTMISLFVFFLYFNIEFEKSFWNIMFVYITYIFYKWSKRWRLWGGGTLDTFWIIKRRTQTQPMYSVKL